MPLTETCGRGISACAADSLPLTPQSPGGSAHTPGVLVTATPRGGRFAGFAAIQFI